MDKIDKPTESCNLFNKFKLEIQLHELHKLMNVLARRTLSTNIKAKESNDKTDRLIKKLFEVPSRLEIFKKEKIIDRNNSHTTTAFDI